MHPFVSERLAALGRQDFERAALRDRQQKTLRAPRRPWRVRPGKRLVGFGTWLPGTATPPA